MTTYLDPIIFRPLMLIADGLRGVHIPQFVASLFPTEAWTHLTDDALAILKHGVDHAEYWDAWTEVLDSGWLRIDGIDYGLEQDDDVWAVPHNVIVANPAHLVTIPNERGEALNYLVKLIDNAYREWRTDEGVNEDNAPIAFSISDGWVADLNRAIPGVLDRIIEAVRSGPSMDEAAEVVFENVDWRTVMVDPKKALNPAIHQHLVGLRYSYRHHDADLHDDGDGESGPHLSGSPAYDEYTTADERIIVEHTGRVGLREQRDLVREAWIDEQAREASADDAFDDAVDDATHAVMARFDGLVFGPGLQGAETMEKRSELMVEINDAITAIMRQRVR